jgi:transposase
MRNTREILRQKWLLKRPHRAIGASVGVSLGAVSLALKRAAEAELTWDVVQVCDDAELEARLYPDLVPSTVRPEPDCIWIHRERHRVGVTLELLHHEYLGTHCTETVLDGRRGVTQARVRGRSVSAKPIALAGAAAAEP